MMKAVYFVLALLTTSVAYSQSVDKIETTVVSYFRNIKKWGSFDSMSVDSQYDSLSFYNQGLLDYLKLQLAYNPFTILSPFPKATKEGLIIATSRDKKFRIYSWDELGGDTMRGYCSIVQYATGKTSTGTSIIYPKYGIEADDADDKDGPGFYYPQIYSVRTKNNKTFYMAIRHGIYMSGDGSAGISAFVIEGDKLNDSIKVFKTKWQHLNAVDYEYNLYSNYDDKTHTERHRIHFSKDMTRMYVPVVGKDFKLTSSNRVYQFDGVNYFCDKYGK